MSGEQRPGDWTCPGCQFNNYASRDVCKNCGAAGGNGGGGGGGGSSNARPGDWVCPSCKYNNYASREMCYKCRCPKGMEGDSFRAGDWWCGGCNYHNYSSRQTCYKCHAPKMAGVMGYQGGYGQGFGGQGFGGRGFQGGYGGGGFGGGGFGWGGEYGGMGGAPGGGGGGGGRDNVRPGDWQCSCGFSNYASRAVCFKCNQAKQPGSEYTGFGMMGGFGGGQGGGFGGGRAGGGRNEMRHGDWMCPACSSHNFASREQCYRCHAPKPADAGDAGAGFGGGQPDQAQTGESPFPGY